MNFIGSGSYMFATANYDSQCDNFLFKKSTTSKATSYSSDGRGNNGRVNHEGRW